MSEDTIVFKARTRGGRYEVAAFECADGTFTINYITRKVDRGASVNMDRAMCVETIKRYIRDCLEVDDIRYSVVEVDRLGIEDQV